MWLVAHTQQQNPHRILTLLLQHGSVSKIGQKFRDRVSKSKHHYFPTSLQSQKPLEFPQNSRYFPQDKTHSIPSSKSPETSCMSCLTTTPKILDTFILSLVLVPTETHATTLDLFLTFLAQWNFSHQDYFHSFFLINFCFYLFTTPKNQNQTTFISPPLTSPITQLPIKPKLTLQKNNLSQTSLQSASNILLPISFLCLHKIPLPNSLQKSDPQNS